MMAKEYTQDSSAVAYIDQVLSGLSEAVKARASNSLEQLVQLSTAIASPSTEPEAVARPSRQGTAKAYRARMPCCKDGTGHTACQTA